MLTTADIDVLLILAREEALSYLVEFVDMLISVDSCSKHIASVLSTVEEAIILSEVVSAELGMIYFHWTNASIRRINLPNFLFVRLVSLRSISEAPNATISSQYADRLVHGVN